MSPPRIWISWGGPGDGLDKRLSHIWFDKLVR